MKLSHTSLFLCTAIPAYAAGNWKPFCGWEPSLILLLIVAAIAVIVVTWHRRFLAKLTEELKQQQRLIASLRRSLQDAEALQRRSVVRILESDERHADLLGHLGLGFFRSTLEGKLLRVNKALAGWAGYSSPEEMVAGVTNVRDLYASPDRRQQWLSSALQSAGPITFEEQFVRQDGDKFTGRITLRLVRSSPDSSDYLEGAVEDTTILRRTLEFADAQRDLSDKLATACTLSQALRPCLETAVRLAEMDGGEIYLRDPVSGAPVLAECSGCGPGGQEKLRRCLTEGCCMVINQPVSTPETEARQACIGCDGTVLAHTMVPILHEGATIGWLVIRSHNLHEIPDFSRAALETVAAQIGSAIARIQGQEAVAASQRQLRALFDSLNDYLVITDLEGHILDANWSLIERAGLAQAELRGKHLADVYSPDVRARFDALRTHGNEQSLVFETLLGGAAIPVEVKLSPAIWDGQNVIIGVGRDLSERRKSEAQSLALREKTALLKEIHHRVKNNLQVISSLLSLQAGQMKSSQERQAFRDSQARVQAMGLLHEQLYQSQDLSRIEFSEYLRTLAAEVLRVSRRSEEISMRLELQPMPVNSEIATPCGLIVNELMTNACKYAFPSRPGEIYLGLKNDAGHNLILMIGDDGVGLPPDLDVRKAKTLGLQLVDDLVSQLKGSWTIEPSEGTLFRIAIPLVGPEHKNGAAHGTCLNSGR